MERLFSSGQKTASTENEELAKLAKDLGVEGFLIPRINYLGSKEKGHQVLNVQDEAIEAKVELELYILSSNPPIVFRAQDQGQDKSWSIGEKYLKNLFDGLLRSLFRAFPK
jgi:hypothetical protein